MNNPSKLSNNHSGLFVCLLITLFLLPWPHGGELLWQYLPFAISFFTLLAIYSLKTKTSSPYDYSSLSTVKTPLIMLSVWLIYSLLQSMPLPLSVVELINPVVLKIQLPLNETQLGIVSSEGSTKTLSTLSIAPGISIAETLKHASYLAVFILALLLLNSERRIVTIVNIVFFSSACIACYSIINHYLNGEFSFVSSLTPNSKNEWAVRVRGTFSYHAHYASFLCLTIPLGIGLLYYNLKNSNKSSGSNAMLSNLLNVICSINILYLLGSLLMFIVLIKTGSRGGNAAIILAFILTTLGLYQANKSSKAFTRYIATPVGLVMIVIASLHYSGVTDSLVSRYLNDGVDPHGRNFSQKSTLKIISQFPLFGTGAGTYSAIYPQYKLADASAVNRSQKSHVLNDYLELMSNQGIVGFTIFSIAILMLLHLLFKGLKKQAKPNNLYGIQAACFCSSTAILLHSFVDFNFHLPVNTVYFWIILAVGVKITMLNKQTINKLAGAARH